MATASLATPKTGSRDDGIAVRLLAWYDNHHRDLPWRVPPADLARGVRPDPYHVWLSEVMLQQTTVEAVKPYFRDFLAKWPDVKALAAASNDGVMRAWAGLGYYSRARNLKACADLVATLPGGFPDSEEGLRALPGIGAYTAAAITAIAFGRPAAVVDGNVERVTARLFDIRTPLPDAKPEIKARVAELVPASRPGDFAQATMDLGATICTPKRPRCMLCPLRPDCRAILSGDPELLPLKAPKADRPKRSGIAYVAVRRDGAVLMRTRAEKGLLGGMTEVPTTGWSEGRGGTGGDGKPPFAAGWRKAGAISHVFTHFELDLEVRRADVGEISTPAGHRWVAAADIAGEALPTVMKKAIEAAIPGATKKPKRP
ncbi:A/G-specific adenine glycosylase [Mesorhizobium sp. LHD-90]|uniref:A/G-specific adenine glycosylase n=1 Tax=Mesorhizobium sp. LHD-90 TaxID=3071414 RepID=UPI0027DFC9C7|nr:A/G-specific adenine glycosylase [Mesorhizobium sp. LHD-90]MDQ6435948.1 A/G-specific adenine glycosylase [Mesorhizobium sp. LHD-90]